MYLWAATTRTARGVAAIVSLGALVACDASRTRSSDGSAVLASATVPADVSVLDAAPTQDAGERPPEAGPDAAASADHAAIDSYLEKAVPTVFACVYEESTPGLPNTLPRGLFAIRYTLGTDGRLTNIAFTRPTGKSGYIDRCVIRRLKSLQLQRPSAPVDGTFVF